MSILNLISLRRLAGAERGARLPQGHLNRPHEGMRDAEDLTRGPCRVFERRHSLADIVERDALVLVERLRVNPPGTARILTPMLRGSW